MEQIRLFKVFMVPTAKTIVGEILDSGYIGQGKKVDEFEKLLETMYQTKSRIITVNSCTSALDLAYSLLKLKPGDKVISTAMTCAATNLPLYNRGVDIVWADVNPITGNIDPEDVAKKMTKDVKAIICVDWCGLACDYEKLKEFGVPVIEDAAHAILTKYKGDYIVNTGGDIVCWSYQAIKHLTTIDGGAIKVPKELEKEAILSRWFGFDRTGSASFRCAQDITGPGYKYHMHDVSAAVGIENLKELDRIVLLSKLNAFKYSDSIKNSKVQIAPYDESSSHWIYTVLVDDKPGFIDYMTKKGIEVSPVHNRNDNYSIFAKYKTDLPNLDSFFSKQFAIPVGWWVTPEEINYIINSINEWK